MKCLIKRMYAGILDAFVVALPVFVLYYMFLKDALPDGDFNMTGLDIRFSIEFLTMALIFIYYIICEAVGQSIGKKIFNLKIVYKNKGIIAKILRPVFKIITLYFVPLVIISLFTPDNLTFYDLILKTKIEETDGTGYSRPSL